MSTPDTSPVLITSLDEYQKIVGSTAVYPRDDASQGLAYCALGLAGEAGEVCNKVKKWLRGDENPPSKAEIADELGDAFWYLAQTAHELGVPLSELASRNAAKLAARKKAGTLKGSGDHR